MSPTPALIYTYRHDAGLSIGLLHSHVMIVTAALHMERIIHSPSQCTTRSVRPRQRAGDAHVSAYRQLIGGGALLVGWGRREQWSNMRLGTFPLGSSLLHLSTAASPLFGDVSLCGGSHASCGSATNRGRRRSVAAFRRDAEKQISELTCSAHLLCCMILAASSLPDRMFVGQ